MFITLIGGYNYKTSSEFLNTKTWEPKPDLPISIEVGASVQFQDSFLIVGGYDKTTSRYLDSIYYFNPVKDDWDLLEQKLDSRLADVIAFMVPDHAVDCS